MKSTAANAYAARRKRIDSQLVQIKKLLHAHVNKATARPADWSLAGDVSHVAEILAEAIGFLGGKPEEDRP